MSLLKTIVPAASVLAAAMTTGPAAYGQMLVTMHSFGAGSDGQQPSSGLIVENGYLDGLTYQGGTQNKGTAFRFDPKTGTETTVYNFTGGIDGSEPVQNLLYASGYLYGISQQSAGAPGGDVFKINPATGGETTVHVFTNGVDGGLPASALVRSGKSIYGTTALGGAHNQGVIYSIALKGSAFSPVYSFDQALGDLSGPYGTPAVSDVGVLYGTGIGGGANGGGGVYQFTVSTGVEKVIYSLPAGAMPYGGLILRKAFLYGTTKYGGAAQSGTVFVFNPFTFFETTLHDFQGSPDGYGPETGVDLIQGYVYGTTTAGGTHGFGEVYAVNVATTETTDLYDFTGGADGAYPYGITYVNGFFYGTTFEGGAHGQGTIFRLTP